MDTNLSSPIKVIGPAYRKQSIHIDDFNAFKANLSMLLDKVNENESEEHNKNLVADFLKRTWYKDDYEINTKERKDLVIHTGKSTNDPVGVIIEAKRPTAKTEMITRENLNVKAFQELLSYYLHERVKGENNNLKYLVVTNVYEWFVFDAQLFEKLFYNSPLKKEYIQWRDHQKTSNDTEHFYKEIAKPYIEKVKDQLKYVWFDLREYRKDLNKTDEATQPKLTALYKLLSPQHLLKLSFANDSNSLNKKFYDELLHIMGLVEEKDGGKKVIRRKPEGKRDEGSLLENAISYIQDRDRLSQVDNLSTFGVNEEEQLFSVGLELCITWLNRILFLKLLEAQLKRYHKGDMAYSFLNKERVPDFDVLERLFFDVLAKVPAERKGIAAKQFAHIPYLNSSLFEQTGLEKDVLQITNLKNDVPLALYSQSVLVSGKDKKGGGERSTLHYLLDFLGAYKFSSDGEGEVQDDNKTLINASVLGLIFEKLNGYKDGSFFTPGFITMYMCRETLRRAVLQKFNQTYQLECDNFDDLGNYLSKKFKASEVLQHNTIINNLKICDPAVGSGHFLVSALNELIAIKSDLGILADKDGKTFGSWKVTVDNDELVVLNEQTDLLFQYQAPANSKTKSENQRLQESLFAEKQTIIENCLFGVDINPNSVKICRLRLWIELLKNAYYTAESEYTDLETLPNIDINIKKGNSLVSRFSLTEDLTDVFKKEKFSIDTYRDAVAAYKETSNKKAKDELLKFIKDIKEQFKTSVYNRDKRRVTLAKLRGELALVETTNIDLFGGKKLSDSQRDLEITRLRKLIKQREQEIDEIENNIIYRNAFEWRFEFPEVLDDNGNFVGFDVVIGNPPYIRQEELVEFKDYFKQKYETFAGTADLYVYFVELGMKLLKPQAHFIYILPNKWMRANYGLNFRKYLKAINIISIDDFGDLPVFESATTYPCLLQLKNKHSTEKFYASVVETLVFPRGVEEYVLGKRFLVEKSLTNDEGWNLKGGITQDLINKIGKQGIPLGQYIKGKIYYGIKTGLNEAFVIDQNTKEELIRQEPRSTKLIKPFLAGREIKRYAAPISTKHIILIPKGFTIKSSKQSPNNLVNEPPPRYGDMPYFDAWNWFKTNYPVIANYLLQFKQNAEARVDKGDFWWEQRACDYYAEFEKPKIIIPAIVKSASYGFDINNHYSNDKTSIIPLDDKYLLGILNSKATDYFMHSIASTKQNGYYEYKPMYLNQLPIPITDNKQPIITLVDQILAAKQANPQADTTALEALIDQLVYQLYNLTPEEIEIVEGK